jgi:RecA/RadA recombinase
MARRKKDDASAPPPADVGPAPESPPPEPVRSMYDLGGSPERGIIAMAELAEKQGRVYGRTNMLPLSDAPYARIRKIPFGIFWLDLRTRGGFVLNRLNRIWGQPSTLKSTLVLRAIRSAQRHCRHCKYPLVRLPESPDRWDCRCPKTRFWLLQEDDYAWLSNAQGLALSRGELPDGAEVKNIKGHEGRVMAVLRCPPPPNVSKGKDRDIILAETYRCEPFRTLLLDSERTTDILWVRANGVIAELVGTLGAKWGEQSLETINEVLAIEKALDEKVSANASPDKRVDLVAIDSTSMLETAANLEKTLSEAPKVASKAMLLGRWVGNFLAACADEGLTARYTPTVLATSQVSTHGIGPKQHAYLAPTDGWKFQHGIALDIEMREAGYEHDEAKTRVRWGNFDFNVRKNKSGGDVRVGGTIKFWLRAEDGHPVGDSDDVGIVMDAARKLGAADPKDWIAQGSGKSAYVMHTRYVKDGKVAFSKVGEMENYLHEHPSVYEDLRSRVLEHVIANGEDVLTKGDKRPSATSEMESV